MSKVELIYQDDIQTKGGGSGNVLEATRGSLKDTHLTLWPWDNDIHKRKQSLLDGSEEILFSGELGLS